MPQLHGRPVCREPDIVQVRCEGEAGEIGEKKERISFMRREKSSKGIAELLHKQTERQETMCHFSGVGGFMLMPYQSVWTACVMSHQINSHCKHPLIIVN